MITLEPGTSQAIKLFFIEKGFHKPIFLRIALQSAGCCDPSLGLMVDKLNESDLVEETEGLTFLMSPETYHLAGDVKISYVEDSTLKGFSLTSCNPISEWDGLAVTTIQI